MFTFIMAMTLVLVQHKWISLILKISIHNIIIKHVSDSTSRYSDNITFTCINNKLHLVKETRADKDCHSISVSFNVACNYLNALEQTPNPPFAEDWN